MDEFARERRIFTPIDEIPDRIKQAFISAEDKNFYAHAGFDPMGIAAAIYQAAQGDRLRGASTITQQVMKNFLLTGDRSGERKIKEIILATRLESDAHQGQDPRALPQRDLPRPELLRRHRGGADLLRQVARGADARRDRLSRGAAAGAERAAPGAREGRGRSRGATTCWRRCATTASSPATRPRRREAEDLRHRAERRDRLGAAPRCRRATTSPTRSAAQLSASLGDEELFTGGLIIRATVDPELQEVAARALRDGLEKYDRGTRVYRGPVARIDARRSTRPTRPGWRQALAGGRGAARHRGLAPGGGARRSARTRCASASRACEEDADGHFLAFADVEWARLRDESNRLRARRGARRHLSTSAT